MLLHLLLTMTTNSLFAQNHIWHYTLKVGAISSDYGLSHISNGTSRETSRAVGFSLTGLADVSLNPYFSIQSGLSFQRLGAQLNYSEFGNTKVQQHTLWLQVPLNFVAKLPLSDSSNFFMNAGPYGGIGLMGSNGFSSSYTGAREDFIFGSEGSQKRFDYGLSFHIGYQLKKGYNFSVGYLMGLADLATRSRYEQRNKAWSLTLGYSF